MTKKTTWLQKVLLEVCKRTTLGLMVANTQLVSLKLSKNKRQPTYLRVMTFFFFLWMFFLGGTSLWRLFFYTWEEKDRPTPIFLINAFFFLLRKKNSVREVYKKHLLRRSLRRSYSVIFQCSRQLLGWSWNLGRQGRLLSIYHQQQWRWSRSFGRCKLDWLIPWRLIEFGSVFVSK